MDTERLPTVGAGRPNNSMFGGLKYSGSARGRITFKGPPQNIPKAQNAPYRANEESDFSGVPVSFFASRR